jgi:enolase
MSISFDAAASEFYESNRYQMQGKNYSSNEMIDYYSELVKKYPVYSIEDGFAENDFQGWVNFTSKLGSKIKIIGDDLFVTNPKILKEGIEKKQANSILIKVNQIGTLTETLETIDLAYKNNFISVISHRSGETGDSFIADLAVATGSGHIKTGSASRSDRMEKYNQLLRIEEELGSNAIFDAVK